MGAPTIAHRLQQFRCVRTARAADTPYTFQLVEIDMNSGSRQRQGSESAAATHTPAPVSERAESSELQADPALAAERIAKAQPVRSADVLALQRFIGNRGLQRLLARDADHSDSAGARDANGVAANAEQAVDRAAGSASEPIPENVRARFERSLGTELADVRLHTGQDSAEAAQAVGAKAYTIGQDIHFAAGQYAPSDPTGEHLLAHEVAHTVQNRGGSVPVMQAKLEVSTPADAAEVEAEQAADAIVAGTSPDISGEAGAVAGNAAMLGRDDDPSAVTDSPAVTGPEQTPASADAGTAPDGQQPDDGKRLNPRITIIESDAVAVASPGDAGTEIQGPEGSATEGQGTEQAGEQTGVMASRAAMVQREGEKGGGGPGVTDIINAGKSVLEIMEKNAPTVSATTDSGNAVPAGVSTLDMSVPDPTPRQIKIRYESDHIWGSPATTVDMVCMWNYNAQAPGKPGEQYILNARVNILGQDIGWSSKVTIKAILRSPFGSGDPKRAILPIDIVVQEHTLSDDVGQTLSGQIEGNGYGTMGTD